MRELHDRYADDDDVVLISVHSPEFDHEKNVANVRAAAAEHGLRYPIVIDNDWRVWRAFDNHYWPALYLFDRNGAFREHHKGELHTDRADYQEWTDAIDTLRSTPG